MPLPTLDQYTEESRRLGYDQVVVRDWAPGYQTPPHDHPFDARGLVVAGEFWLTVGERSYRYGPGEIFELPRGTLHSERYGETGATFWAARRG